MRNVAGLTLRGMTGAAVEVEAEITGGMPAFAVVGLPDTAVKEARERSTVELAVALDCTPEDVVELLQRSTGVVPEEN